MNVLVYYSLRCLTVAVWFLIAIQTAKRRCDLDFLNFFCRYKTFGEYFPNVQEIQHKILLIFCECFMATTDKKTSPLGYASGYSIVCGTSRFPVMHVVRQTRTKSKNSIVDYVQYCEQKSCVSIMPLVHFRAHYRMTCFSGFRLISWHFIHGVLFMVFFISEILSGYPWQGMAMTHVAYIDTI